MPEGRVSSDAMPALTGSRCASIGQSGRSIPANKVVPQKLFFLSLFPLRGSKDFFAFQEVIVMRKQPGKRW